MPPRKNTRRKTRGLPRCLDELDMDQDDITKYFKPKKGAAWTAAEVELIKRRIATADRKIATLQLEKERLLNVLHEVPVELLSPGGGGSSSPRPSKVKVVDISQDEVANVMAFTNPYADRKAAVIRMMGRISYCCVDDLLAPSERPPLPSSDNPASDSSKPVDHASSLDIPPRPDGLPSPFPRVLDQHGPYLSIYPTVPGFFDNYDELFVLSNTELVATADELEATLATYLDPLVYSKDGLHYYANNAVDFLSRLYAGVERNKARGVRLDAVKRYLEELFEKHPRPKVAEDTPAEPSLARNMQLTHFCEPQESLQPVEHQRDIDETELMDEAEENEPPVHEAITLTPNEMVSDNEGPVHFRCSVATSATVQQEDGGSQELDWDIDLDHVPSSPIIEVSGDELSLLGEEQQSRGASSQPPLAFSDDDEIQCLSGGSRSTTPAKSSSAADAPSEDGTAWLDSLPLVERIKALGAMRRGSDVSRWANGSWKRARLSLASLGVPEASGESTMPYEDEATAAVGLSDPFMSDDAFAGAVMVGGSSEDALPETASSECTAEPRAAVESVADVRAGRSVLESMAWDTLKDEELKRWMSFFGLKVTAGTTSRGNMVRTLGEIARYVDKGRAAAETSTVEPELPKRKRQKKSPAKSREEKKREAEEKRKANKKALVHAIRKDTEIWQRMLLFETMDITDLANRLKEQDPSLVCDQTLLRELLEEQGVQFCNTLQAGTQRHAPRKPRGPARRGART